MRTPGRLIMMPPTTNIMPLTIAADVPMFPGSTTERQHVRSISKAEQEAQRHIERCALWGQIEQECQRCELQHNPDDCGELAFHQTI
jgi:hypothetical protein